MMANNREAFTLIELIFVIFITAILAVTAIPRLAELARNSHRTNVIAFVGTLNRTVGPSMWSKAILSNDGKVTSSDADLCKDIADYVDLPKEVIDFSIDCKITVDSNFGIPITNNFYDGTTKKSPKWEIEF